MTNLFGIDDFDLETVRIERLKWLPWDDIASHSKSSLLNVTEYDLMLKCRASILI